MKEKDCPWENSATNIFDVTLASAPVFWWDVGIDKITWGTGLASGKARSSIVLNGLLPTADHLMKRDDWEGLKLDIVYRELGYRADYNPELVLIRLSEFDLVKREIVKPVIYDPAHLSPLSVLVTLDCDMESFWEIWNSLKGGKV